LQHSCVLFSIHDEPPFVVGQRIPLMKKTPVYFTGVSEVLGLSAGN
jgi:hypothetical protein